MDLSKSYDYFQPEKDTARIHIVGCGSVGATVAEYLARCGITKFTLWDFDVVEPHNLANQICHHFLICMVICQINNTIVISLILHPKLTKLSGQT